MSEIISYKTIYRLDYPLSYRLLDSFGTFSEIVHEITSKEPFSKAENHLDLVQRSLTTTAHCSADPFKFNLSLKTINAVIDHPKGEEVYNLHKHPAIKLADSVLEEFQEHAPSRFERVGFRTWVIFEDDRLKFETLKNYFIGKNRIIETSIKSQFENSDDVGVIFESSNLNGDLTRISLGPYQKKEQKKYFSFDIDISEGLIIDIDVWQTKCKIPNLSLSKNSRHYFKAIADTTKSIAAGILNGELQ